MDYTIQQSSDAYFILGDSEMLRTPKDNPVGSFSKDLIDMVIDDLRVKGSDPSVWSTYSLLCSYLDYASPENRDDLVSSLMTEIESDPVYNSHHNMAEEYRAFLDSIGNKSANLSISLKTYFNTFGFRKLFSVIYATAHFHSPICFAAYFAGTISEKLLKQTLMSAGMTFWPFHPKMFKKEVQRLKSFCETADDRNLIVC